MVGAVVLLVWAARPHLEEVRAALTPWLWAALALAAGLNVTGNVVLADNWSRLLALLSHPLTSTIARRIWGRAQLARYAVGSAQLLSRPALARSAGVPLRIGVTSTLLETVWMTGATAAAVVGLAPTWIDVPYGGTVLWLAALAGVVALVALTVAPAPTLQPALWLLRRIGRPVELDPDGSGRAISAWYVLNMLLRTATFLLLVVASGADPSIETMVVGSAAYLTGNLIGILVVFAPGGLGPREAVSALLLASILDPAGIIVVLAGTRLAELAAEGIFIATFRGAPPATAPPATATPD